MLGFLQFLLAMFFAFKLIGGTRVFTLHPANLGLNEDILTPRRKSPQKQKQERVQRRSQIYSSPGTELDESQTNDSDAPETVMVTKRIIVGMMAGFYPKNTAMETATITSTVTEVQVQAVTARPTPPSKEKCKYGVSWKECMRAEEKKEEAKKAGTVGARHGLDRLRRYLWLYDLCT
ncbi:hypothetical protein M422DRAFT_258157 [Sphaerobolus stellatus SS14]|uniref:Unplaced genomic scaffold SPHSTscaffold_80, whole genome shotgun sequence n=1 Tax=Sphaerobolus stellatus (strain SS14) TaxID=990650 RepID=A0A0C9U7P5_SPHS4|nr:hypothetical protein M422DRAFT_258157 [Sphaerobolus stellatus SS14]